MITLKKQSYGRDATNRISQAEKYETEGARALIESFYYAFNQRNMVIFEKVWASHALIQLNNPLGGIMRGFEPIASLYKGIFTGPSKVWVELNDIVEFQCQDMVVFAGHEKGEFTKGEITIPLNIRTSRIIQWFGSEVGWKQTHHHGSIDNPTLLAEYQQAIRG